MKRPHLPGFYYGGFDRNQKLRGASQPFSRFGPEKWITTTGSVPLLKLHGSLSWSISDGIIEMYQDLRPVWRHGGTAAIVPPVTEKYVPRWLQSVWTTANRELCESDIWIVVGYSMPDYDVQVKELLSNCAGNRSIRIIICDPNSESIMQKYKDIAPNSRIVCLEALPDCLGDVAQFL
jgi:hypothetical protein